METLIENNAINVSLDKKLGYIQFTNLSSQIMIDYYRDIWDKTIILMNKYNIKKLLLDSRLTNFKSVRDYLFVHEGLIQVMARQILSKKLYTSFLINQKFSNLFPIHDKLSPQYNQYSEIEYNFFCDFDQAVEWLVSSDYMDSKNFFGKLFKTSKKQKKTSVTEEFDFIEKNTGNKKLNKLYREVNKDDIEEFRKRNS
jgi:hypothetical protein